MTNTLEITNYDYIIKPFEKKKAGRLLKKIAKKLSMPFWISAGTALGLYRDGDLIDGDTDIDFAMQGYQGIDREIIKIVKGRIIRTIYELGRPMQIAFEKNGTIIDFYFHWQNGLYLENHGESGWTRMKAEICLNPQWINTKYGTFPIPQEEYFVIRYGEDWETPQDKKPIFYEI